MLELSAHVVTTHWGCTPSTKAKLGIEASDTLKTRDVGGPWRDSYWILVVITDMCFYSFWPSPLRSETVDTASRFHGAAGWELYAEGSQTRSHEPARCSSTSVALKTIPPSPLYVHGLHLNTHGVLHE